MNIKVVSDVGIAILDLCTIVFAIVSAVGASSKQQWTEACFWLLLLILLKLHRDSEK